MAPKKKDDKKAGKADAKAGKADAKAGKAEKATPRTPIGENLAVQWFFLLVTVGLIVVSMFTSFKCFMQWRKTHAIRADLHVMRTAVAQQYENLRKSHIKDILEAVKEEAEDLILTEKAISRTEFGIKEVIALFRNDWIQGQNAIFHFSTYEFYRRDCYSNCEKFNGTPIFIGNSKKEAFLEEYISATKLGCFWLPIILSANNQWYKIDETVIDIAFWGSVAQPNSRCACLLGGCTTPLRCWAKIPCNSLKRCMCEKKSETSVSYK